MAVEIPFRRDFAYEYGKLEQVAPGIRRIIARNPGPFTFRGTGTYVVGEGKVAVIDPGPDLPEHIEALLMDLAGEEVTHIWSPIPIATTHPATADRKRPEPNLRLRAPCRRQARRAWGRGRRRLGLRTRHRSQDSGEIANDGWRLRPCIPRPYLDISTSRCRLDILFSGDHVMGWSTGVIAPPDGNMAAYMASLDKLLERTTDLLADTGQRSPAARSCARLSPIAANAKPVF